MQTSKELAEKAKAAAIDLDKQLDESIGIDAAGGGSKSPTTSGNTANTQSNALHETTEPDDDDFAALDDAWGDDEFDQTLDESSPVKTMDETNNDDKNEPPPQGEDEREQEAMSTANNLEPSEPLSSLIAETDDQSKEKTAYDQVSQNDEKDALVNGGLDHERSPAKDNTVVATKTSTDTDQSMDSSAPRIINDAYQNHSTPLEESPHDADSGWDKEDEALDFDSEHVDDPTEEVPMAKPDATLPGEKDTQAGPVPVSDSYENKEERMESLGGILNGGNSLLSSLTAVVPQPLLSAMSSEDDNDAINSKEDKLSSSDANLQRESTSSPKEENQVLSEPILETANAIDVNNQDQSTDDTTQDHKVESAPEEQPTQPDAGDAWTQDDGDLEFTETEREEDNMVTDESSGADNKSPQSKEHDIAAVSEEIVNGEDYTHNNVDQAAHQSASEEVAVTNEQIPGEHDQPESSGGYGEVEQSSEFTGGGAMNESLVKKLQSQEAAATRLQKELEEVRERLRQREQQLMSKTEQLTTIEAMHESEKAELQQRIQNTKEEAKKRIQKARERVDAAEGRLKAATANQSSKAVDAAQQAEIIAALRSEGEALARKQAEMEKATRAAKVEARELREKLEDEVAEKQEALDALSNLEEELKETKEHLAEARKGESKTEQLLSDLQKSREESEYKSVTILSLEQQVKELKAEIKELTTELEAAREGAAMETQQQQQKLRKEQNEMLTDLDNKLRTVEREAAVREDALRREVDELRKRWQDAVRRADSLSMDIQSCTAPLMRQLESAERQTRAKAAAAAEIETKLRSELEESVIVNEKLTKEVSELKTKFVRLDRKSKEDEAELRTAKLALEEKTLRVSQLEEALSDMEVEGAKKQEEWAEVERLANEGVARVRSEMTKTVVESEERYRAQINSMKNELDQEKEVRRQLELQVEKLVANAGVLVPPSAQRVSTKEAKPKRLQSSQGQEEILAGALGLEDVEDESDNDADSDWDEGGDDGAAGARRSSSFAALEHLTARLKAAKVEVSSLRKSFAEAERSRKELAEELGEARNARDKLPLFESKMRELTFENEQQALEIQGLREDIAEVKELYRSQLNMLLEEQAKVTKKPDKPIPKDSSSDDSRQDPPNDIPEEAILWVP